MEFDSNLCRVVDLASLPDELQDDGSRNNDIRDLNVVPIYTSSAINGTHFGDVIALVTASGVVKIIDQNRGRTQHDLNNWASMFPHERKSNSIISTRQQRDADEKGSPKTGLNAPKHGKEDPKNEIHVGGNTWAGGTGGSDTAGLGGRGGPYRLDKGHTVHQVSDESKAQVSAEAKAQAAKIAQEALQKRLDDISMGKDEYDIYNRFRGRVQNQVRQLKTIIDEFSKRSKERVWLRNQSSGELDDAKIVDGMTGEKLVFKRRGISSSSAIDSSGNQPESVLKRIDVVMDVSGSMYRFNGQDQRLERVLETALMVMESIGAGNDSKGGDVDEVLQYSLSGHSGDSSYIPYVQYGEVPRNESERFMILQRMIAHSQFCSSGDHTLEAIEGAVKRVVNSISDSDANSQRFVIVVSDANFKRYGISTRQLSSAMKKDPRVKVHLILIASLGDEADKTASALPEGLCHVCDGHSGKDIVDVFRDILTGTGGILDVRNA